MDKLKVVSFGQEDIENVLSNMNDKELDEMPFGAIQLNADGVILSYNAKESIITGRRAEDVIGRNFFMEVAPCTRRPEFHGVFRQGVKNDDLNILFEYVFDYKMNPTKVKVHMKKALAGDSYWIIVKRI